MVMIPYYHQVEEWLKHLETNNLQRVPIGSKVREYSRSAER
jgi:hypothetical protein